MRGPPAFPQLEQSGVGSLHNECRAHHDADGQVVETSNVGPLHRGHLPLTLWLMVFWGFLPRAGWRWLPTPTFDSHGHFGFSEPLSAQHKAPPWFLALRETSQIPPTNGFSTNATVSSPGIVPTNKFPLKSPKSVFHLGPTSRSYLVMIGVMQGAVYPRSPYSPPDREGGLGL